MYKQIIENKKSLEVVATILERKCVGVCLTLN